MSLTAIVSVVMAVAKAVPYIYKLIDQISNAMVDYKVSQINAQRVTKDNQRTALIKAIDKAETNEEILALSVTLHTLNNGSLQQPNTQRGL